MNILKFGGTSLLSTEAILQTMRIIQETKKEQEVAVVCSAFGGITNQLIAAANFALEHTDAMEGEYYSIEQKHLQVISELLPVHSRSSCLAEARVLLNELHDYLTGITYVKELTPKTLDTVMSFGERLSTHIVADALQAAGTECEFVDARDIIKTDSVHGNAQVQWSETSSRITSYFKHLEKVAVITGFIASDQQGNTTTLGRGGSDYTAAIVGSAIGVKEIQIWTDVNGILSANPQHVADASTIEHLQYEEAMELSHFGARVVYPPTILPALKKGIPIRVKNTFDPTGKHTLITDTVPADAKHPIRGISSINSITLLRLEGSGLIGIPGVSKRLFGTLAERDINVILISQASSEHSICFAVKKEQSSIAIQAIADEFVKEIETSRIEPPIQTDNLVILAIAGNGMHERTGIAGTLFQALGQNGINIVAIAQGSSERNISVVLSEKDEEKALNVVHHAFFSPQRKQVHVFLVGTGLIGNNLLAKLRKQKEALHNEHGVEIHVHGIANTKSMLIAKQALQPDTWDYQKHTIAEPTDLSLFVERMKALNLENSVFVDCTANEDITEHYNNILRANIGIVTPNKKANSGTMNLYKELKDTAREKGVPYLYETNVGAGLPIINTLNDLTRSGDSIVKIEAVLSGTLSYIFNEFTGDRRFCDIVKEAKELGYTEPDPRDDLNGMDVARKLLILARESGIPLELDNVQLESILPKSCLEADSIDTFFASLEAENDYFEQLKKDAEAQQKRLRFIATLENGSATVALTAVPHSHPFYGLSGSDNIIAFTTAFYFDYPLVVQGPGAGADVTATGVLADIIRSASLFSPAMFVL